MTPAVAAIRPPCCALCGTPVSPDRWNAGKGTCMGCLAPLTALVFPAASSPPRAVAALAAVEGEASCFYHARRRAETACDQCGRFVCSLCHIDLSGQVWCPLCLESQREQGTLTALQTRRVRYDILVFWLAMLPALVFAPFTIFTSPAAIFVGLWKWKAPMGLVQRYRPRLYIGLVFAALTMVGWLALIGFLIATVIKGRGLGGE